MRVYIHVTGIAAPQGSKRHVGNGVMIESSKDVKGWRDAISAECRIWLASHPAEPIDAPVHVCIDFAFPKPKSDPHRHWHAVNPDLDKLARAVLDALVKGAVLKDDSRVAILQARKAYCTDGEPAGARITVESLANSEAVAREESKRRALVAKKAS